jgi:hypothetical protein
LVKADGVKVAGERAENQVFDSYVVEMHLELLQQV